MTTKKSFWSRVDKSGGRDACWLWVGGTNGDSYGQLWFRGKVEGAHRVAYMLRHGIRLKVGEWVLHKCDNPPCCNPGHLFLGTRRDNALDSIKKGRWKDNRGSKHDNAKLSEHEVVRIRRMWASGKYKTMRKIADRFGKPYEAVRGVILRRTWKHL